jgi:hypothetical protein
MKRKSSSLLEDDVKQFLKFDSQAGEQTPLDSSEKENSVPADSFGDKIDALLKDPSTEERAVCLLYYIAV